MIKDLENEYIFICFDNSTDPVGRAVGVILVAKLSKDNCNRLYMILCEEILEVKNKTISQISFI